MKGTDQKDPVFYPTWSIAGWKLEKEGEGYLKEKSNKHSGRMSALINDLLSFAQISSIPKTPEKIILNELIKQTLIDLELEINESGAKNILW